MLTILFLTRFVVVYIRGKKQSATRMDPNLVPVKY